MLKKYKNLDDIKTKFGQIRAERIDTRDKSLFYFNEKSFTDDFTTDDSDTVELAVYDLDDNLLFWQDIGLPNYEIVNENIILKPGDDLRRRGFSRGEYRVIYSFFKDIIGSSDFVGSGDRLTFFSVTGGIVPRIRKRTIDWATKLYIEEISPSRTEIRVLPVKTGISQVDMSLRKRFADFSDAGVTISELKTLFLKHLTDHDFGLDTTNSVGEDFLRNQWNQIINSIEIQWKNFNITDEVLHSDTYISFLNILITEALGKVFPLLIESNAEVFKYIKNRVMDIGTPTVQEFSNDYRILSHLINFGKDRNYLVANWTRDDIKYPEFPYSIVFKLYDPLPDDIQLKSKFWVSKEISLPVVNRVFLHGFEEPENRIGNYLRGANFDIEVDRLSDRSTPFESWDSILSSNPTMSQELIDFYFSGSIHGVDINEDFTDYQNFIQFGSAKRRLDNFQNKLQLIEDYTDTINFLKNISGSASMSINVLSDITSFGLKKTNLIAGFDTYEKFLYENSGSQYSASVPVSESAPFNPIGEWPKQNTVEPYILYSITSSEATNWFLTQSTIAQDYDINNYSRFVNNIPNYLQVDSGSSDFIIFLDMIGQYYDFVYTYITALTNLSNRDENMFEGLSKDLTFNVAKSFGFDLKNGNDFVELWKYTLGTNISGSFEQTGSIQSRPYGDITKEIWRRILNNLPYILKTKGTIRSVNALLNCYGIPSSVLTVREYGGPDPIEFSQIQDKSSFIFEGFVYALDLKGSQSISFPWTFSPTPSTLEITFKTKYVGFSTMSIVNAESNWGISLIKSGSKFEEQLGYVQFKNSSTVVTSSQFKFYNDEFYTVGIFVESGSQSTHSLYVKNFETDRIVFSSTTTVNSSSTAWSSASVVYIGGDGVSFGNQFSGSVMEFRLFKPVISESVFDNHVRWPKSYNSNTVTSSFDDVILRYSFGQTKNHNVDAVVTDIKPDQTSVTPGSASGFSNETNYSPFTKTFAALVPDIGIDRFISNKIRIENNGIERGVLSPTERVEVSQFDKSPLDSNRLGIYFSPIDTINKDIIGTFAGTDLVDFIGDPQDIYNSEYPELRKLQTFYFKKFSSVSASIDYNAFIRVLENYDTSLFEQIKNLLPLRANSTVGILIEPTILERYKEKSLPLNRELNSYSATVETASLFAFTSSESSIEVEVAKLTIPILTSSITPLDALTSLPTPTGSTDYTLGDPWQQQSVFIGTINPLSTTTASFVEPISDIQVDSGSFLSKFLEQFTSDRRLRYEGTVNTIDVSIDGKEPVEVLFSNPNKLITTDIGPSKLKVE